MTDWGDTVHTTVTVHLSWWDRFKVLLGAPLYVAVRVNTEFEVGALESDSQAWTHPWNFWRRWFQPTGYAESPDTKGRE